MPDCPTVLRIGKVDRRQGRAGGCARLAPAAAVIIREQDMPALAHRDGAVAGKGDVQQQRPVRHRHELGRPVGLGREDGRNEHCGHPCEAFGKTLPHRQP